MSMSAGFCASDPLASRMRGLRLITFDVDGVLTDARIYVDDHGHEFKAYSAQDGQGVKMLLRAGLHVGLITGSRAPGVAHRARMLGIAHVVTGAEDKLTPWERLRAELDVPAAACAHVGDDLPDVPLFNACGLAVAVPHAPAAVRARAHYVTRVEGGRGAVRELCDLILAAQGALAAQHAAYGA
jgi:3-deoxy-D-manno-octulosonate 8-phosphate phosphatase (KDO 8-P phosphatase)